MYIDEISYAAENLEDQVSSDILSIQHVRKYNCPFKQHNDKYSEKQSHEKFMENFNVFLVKNTTIRQILVKIKNVYCRRTMIRVEFCSYT